MLENILVIIIVLAAALYVGRQIYLSVSSKKSPCDCAGKCDGCDLIDKDDCGGKDS